MVSVGAEPPPMKTTQTKINNREHVRPRSYLNAFHQGSDSTRYLNAFKAPTAHTATQLEQARVTRSLDAWHDDGMNRIRLSTTVDASLLEHARSVRSGTTDAALIDEALAALLARYRSAEVDASYAAYDEHTLEEPDEWGDLASFRRAAASS